MKRFILSTLAGLALLAAPQAWAWSYSDGDLLLVFRNGSQDVEFDLGSVSNYLGRTNGYTTTVTGWDLGLVTGTFGSLSGATFVLAAANSTNWVTGAEPNTSAYNVSAGKQDLIYNAISGVGLAPLNPIHIPTNGVNGYVINAGGLYKKASYDYVVSSGGHGFIPTLGGNLPFTVEQSIPGFLDFWQIEPTIASPAPPDKLIGTFSIDANGVLTFVAGPRASTVTGVSHSGNVSQIKFTTTVGNTYSIAYTNQLGGSVTNWPVDAGSLIGDGNIDTISHTNSGGVEFYRIRTQ